MKRFIIVCLALVLITSAVFASDFGGNAGVNLLLAQEMGSSTNDKTVTGFGLFFDTVNTLGKRGKVEFALGGRTEISMNGTDASTFILSGLATAGVNINLSSHFSIYVMPGYGAYVVLSEDNSQLNLLGLGLMSGLRYHISEEGFLIALSGALIYPLENLTMKDEKRGSMLLGSIGLGVGFRF